MGTGEMGIDSEVVDEDRDETMEAADPEMLGEGVLTVHSQS